MSHGLRALALALAGILLANNILAAQGNVSVIVTMVAIAFLPLLWERSARGAVMVCAFFVLWATVLPAAIERAGAEKLAYVEMREDHDSRRDALERAQREALAECRTGYGGRCKGILAVIETRRDDGGEAAPAPAGVEMLARLLGIANPALLVKALALANALGSELAIAALIHFAVFWHRAPMLAPRPPPATAAEYIDEHLVGEVVAADLYADYEAAWLERGQRPMSRHRFMNLLADHAGRAGFRRQGGRGPVTYVEKL